ncbi:MAG: hypothetical protein KDB71_09180 [Mycobacterium sp.]|nr:hypothetical protein [Mycobacterium sp.]
MLYLLLILAAATTVYVALRVMRAQTQRSATRVIGPDDDPEFLRRLDQGDNNPR